MIRRLIPEEHRRLGRHVEHDERSRAFPADMAPAIVSVNHASVGLPLNQGNLGSCTANALCGSLNTDPNYLKVTHGPFTEHGALTLYERETRDEGQPYPPNDPGGTGLAVCKAARELGWISSYTHTFSLEEALQALVLRPVITGIDWYEGFDTPNPATGLVKIAGSVRGGHEIVATQIVVAEKLVGFWNSWGDSWGLGGRFFMSWDTWGTLLAQQGDVTVPVR